MWCRLVSDLRCPLCAGPLQCHSFAEERIPISANHLSLARRQSIYSADFDRYVNEGVLLCHSCRVQFAITRGVPVLLPYSLPLHGQFTKQFQPSISALPVHYDFPNVKPISGERNVLDSFSSEWL